MGGVGFQQIKTKFLVHILIKEELEKASHQIWLGLMMVFTRHANPQTGAAEMSHATKGILMLLLIPVAVSGYSVYCGNYNFAIFSVLVCLTAVYIVKAISYILKYR